MTSILLSYRDAISRDARSRIRERIRRPVKFHWRGARALRRALWRQSPYLGDVDTRWKPPSFFFFFLRQSSFERKKVKEIRLLLEIIPWKESPFSFFFELFFQPPDILFPFQIFFRVATPRDSWRRERECGHDRFDEDSFVKLISDEKFIDTYLLFLVYFHLIVSSFWMKFRPLGRRTWSASCKDFVIGEVNLLIYSCDLKTWKEYIYSVLKYIVR